MTYLLDTHALLWFLRSPASLPRNVLSIIEDSSSSLAVSLATPWEIAMKTSAGRLDAADVVNGFESIMAQARFNLLAPTLAHVVRSSRLPGYHRDPFDRLIVAQTLELGWSLLSKDAIFDACGVRHIWN